MSPVTSYRTKVGLKKEEYLSYPTVKSTSLHFASIPYRLSIPPQSDREYCISYFI